MSEHQRRLDRIRTRLRAQTNGQWLFDTCDACLLYEYGRHPAYAVPADDIDLHSLDLQRQEAPDGASDGQFWRPHSKMQVKSALIRTWDEPPVDLPELANFIVIDMSAADRWFVEDTEVFFRPRDPYRRVDIYDTSRHIKVWVDDELVAESHHPRLLLETGLPSQWYLPRVDVNWSAFEASDLQTRCQYKGIAHYWHVTGVKQHQNMAWSYAGALPELPKLHGFVGFPAGHPAVQIRVDGVAVSGLPYDKDWINPSLAVGQHPE